MTIDHDKQDDLMHERLAAGDVDYVFAAVTTTVEAAVSLPSFMPRERCAAVASAAMLAGGWHSAMLALYGKNDAAAELSARIATYAMSRFAAYAEGLPDGPERDDFFRVSRSLARAAANSSDIERYMDLMVAAAGRGN